MHLHLQIISYQVTLNSSILAKDGVKFVHLQIISNHKTCFSYILYQNHIVHKKVYFGGTKFVGNSIVNMDTSKQFPLTFVFQTILILQAFQVLI